MNSPGPKADFASSVRARLLNVAKERGEDFNLTLNRFAVERFLVRLSLSKWRGKFLLKGALLFDLWFDQPHRPTRDADLLGFVPEDESQLRTIVSEICRLELDDGIRFDERSITIDAIREDARYGGLRVRLVGVLANARCSVQIDVGYGDAVTPRAAQVEYPSLLPDLPPARLLAYPRETVFAEKLEAIVSLGIANSRMKDFYDLRALMAEGGMDEVALSQAIAATFSRRGTTIPERAPVGLSDDFAREPGKLAQWKAFLGKNRLQAPALEDVVTSLREFTAPHFASAAAVRGAAKPA
jgi:Nucleotidyl transferase AbiEii toxin, Type IV TA system